MRIETIEHINALLPAFSPKTTVLQFFLIVEILKSPKGTELLKAVDINRDEHLAEWMKIRDLIGTTIHPKYKAWVSTKLVEIAHKVHNKEITLED